MLGETGTAHRLILGWSRIQKLVFGEMALRKPVSDDRLATPPYLKTQNYLYYKYYNSVIVKI